jgi:hypothetical protein
MRENRTYGSEGGETSNGKLPYPYHLNSSFSPLIKSYSPKSEGFCNNNCKPKVVMNG